MDRSTRQRDAIRGAFTPKGRPLTPKEIQDHADREAPGVSLATIYRTVKALEEQGEIVRVELPGEFKITQKFGLQLRLRAVGQRQRKIRRLGGIASSD